MEKATVEVKTEDKQGNNVLFELKPSNKCLLCLGRGVLLVRHPGADTVRVITICTCVKKTIPEKEASKLRLTLLETEVKGEPKLKQS